MSKVKFDNICEGVWSIEVDLENKCINFSQDCLDFINKVGSIVESGAEDRYVSIPGMYNTFLLLLRDVVGLKGEFPFKVHKGIVKYCIPKDFDVNDLWKICNFKEVVRYLKVLGYDQLSENMVEILKYKDIEDESCDLCNGSMSYITIGDKFARIADKDLYIDSGIGGSGIILNIEYCPKCGRKL